MSSHEVLSLKLPDVPEEEWALVREQLLAAAKLELGRRQSATPGA